MMTVSELSLLAALLSLPRLTTSAYYLRQEEGPCGRPLSCAEAELLCLVRADGPTWISQRSSSDNVDNVLASCRVTDGGGWTVIQRRVNGRVSFNKRWERYLDGFGWRGPNDDMWFGNEHIREVLKAHGRSILQIKLEARDGSHALAEYSNFRLDTKKNKYRLFIDAAFQLVNMTDSLAASNGSRFSTRDKNFDRFSCAGYHNPNSGGWWWPEGSYKQRCTQANLNGIYGTPTAGSYANFWSGFRGLNGLRWTEMRVRPSNFNISRVRCNNPCLHDGRCAYDGGSLSYKCLCIGDYGGVLCEYSSWFLPKNMITVTIGVVVLVIALCILLYIMSSLMKQDKLTSESEHLERMQLLHKAVSSAQATDATQHERRRERKGRSQKH